MRKIGILISIFNVFVLLFSAIFPRNLGEHTPVWEVRERLFGEEYGELRSEYFISLNMKKAWHDMTDIFWVGSDHDIFRITKVYLNVKKEIADSCIINSSGGIEWGNFNSHIFVRADALTDTPLSIAVGPDDYILDDSEGSKAEFVAAMGMDAETILETVGFIRSEYRTALNALSEMEYRRVCARIGKAVRKVTVTWGIYVLVWGTIRVMEKRYRKLVDDSMKDYL